MSPRLTDEQLAEPGLGASSIAVIAGVSPYRTPFEEYLIHIGELDPRQRATDEDRKRWERGHRFEDIALDWYAQEQGIAAGRKAAPGERRLERMPRTVHHPRLSFVRVHPDARVVPFRGTTYRLVEAKTGPRRWDAVPQHVEAQVQMQMAATGADVVDVALQTFDGPPYVYEVPRNDALIAALEDLARKFWDRVERRDPPPVDPSAAANRYLDRMWQDAPAIAADPDQRALLARLLDVRAEAKRLEAEDSNLVIALKQSMAGAPRLEAPGVGSVLWTPPFEKRSTAWKVIAEGLLRNLPANEREALISLNTTVERDVRQFRPSPWKTREEEAA